MPTGRILENTIVRLLRSSPFYGHLLVGLRKSKGGGFPIGITLRDGVPTLTLDEALFEAYPPREQEALLEHCILHLLHLHPLRRRGRNRHDWDLASDLAINGMIPDMPAGAPMPAGFSLQESLAAEEYYQLLVDSFDTGNIAGSGAGSGEQDSAGKAGRGDGSHEGGSAAADPSATSPLDDHRVWDEADGTPLRLAEEMVRHMVHEAWNKSDGELPVELRPLVESLLAPGKLPWRLILRQFVATAGRLGKKSSWQREHRRFEHLTPGSRKRHRLNLVIGVDVSESTDSRELRESFARELLRIARSRESILTVVYANSSVQKIETLRGNGLAVESYHGGGFTDLRPVFDYARAMKPRPAAVIYLTDGAGPAPEKMEFPTLWVLTGEGKKPVPWGLELRLEN